MRDRLLMLSSMAVLGGSGTLVSGAFLSGPKPVIVGMAVAPLYTLRVGLWSMPDRFDFDQYRMEVAVSTQVAQHLFVSVLSVAAGTTVGILSLEIAEAIAPGIGGLLSLLVSFVASILVGINLLLRLNETYAVPADGNAD